LETLNIARNEVVLLPAYIGITEREGSGVFDPIIETKIEYDFYAVDRKLQIDLQSIIDLIETKKVKAILCIHYFGFPQESIFKLNSICKKNKIILIEDCAHTISSNIGNIQLGSIGDYAFFSLHKYFPMEIGGMFRSNSKYNELYNSLNDEEILDERNISIFLCSNKPFIKIKRIQNYNYLLSKIKNFKSIELLYPELPEGTVPLNFPVIIKSGIREKLYFKLMELGAPTVALYYRLIEEIEPKRFPESYYVSKNILNIPIHQDIKENDIDVFIYKLEQAMKELALE